MDAVKGTRFRAKISEIDFKSIIAHSLHQLRTLEGAHKLEVKTTIESYLPFYSDAKQLGIIFNNIISNAIKYRHIHEIHPTLTITIEVDPTKAVMTFKDNGIGIPGENLGKVFDMFFRSPDTRTDGSGLGLYIVKEIVRKLKGKISVSSALNEGSCFRLELPNRIDPDLLRKLNRLVQNSK